MSAQPSPSSGSPSVEQVRALVEAARQADGAEPLNEAALIAISSGTTHAQVSAQDGNLLLGYAQVSNGEVQLVVHPSARGKGLARALVRQLADDPAALTYWAFGDREPARSWARRVGMSPIRRLLIMERQLDQDLQPGSLPPGVSIRAYQPSDAEALLEVNAAAFAHHPEQGSMDTVDLAARMAEPWYRAADLLVATDAGDNLLGFHWTKQHDAELGEVYVLAVRPDAGGGGIGRALLSAGLQHLASLGKRRVILYVEDDQPRVVDLYRRAGFAVVHQDVVYAIASPSLG